MKKCKGCGKLISNYNHEYCYDCWCNLEEIEDKITLHKCKICGTIIFNPDHEYCYDCWYNLEEIEDETYEYNNYNEQLIRERYHNQKTIRTKDGHYVASRGEKIIDDAFYDSHIRHIYEKVIYSSNDDLTITCDWYLEDYDLYVEFWGVENSKNYDSTKDFKLKLYKKNNCNLLELFPDDVDTKMDLIIQKIKNFSNKAKKFS